MEVDSEGSQRLVIVLGGVGLVHGVDTAVCQGPKARLRAMYVSTLGGQARCVTNFQDKWVVIWGNRMRCSSVNIIRITFPHTVGVFSGA